MLFKCKKFYTATELDKLFGLYRSETIYTVMCYIILELELDLSYILLKLAEIFTLE